MSQKILFLLIAVISVGSMHGQNGSFQELSFEMTVLRSNVLPLEPIPLKFSVENRTDTVITLDTSLDLSSPSLSLEIRKPTGEVIVPGQLSIMTARSVVTPREARPGEIGESFQVLDFRLQDHFDLIGEYHLRATYKNLAGQSVRTSWVTVTVTAPTGMDLTAYEFILGKINDLEGIERTTPFLQWNIEDLESFVDRFPETVYSTYVLYRLGVYYFEKDKERSKEHFRRLQEKPDFVFAKDVTTRVKLLSN